MWVICNLLSVSEYTANNYFLLADLMGTWESRPHLSAAADSGMTGLSPEGGRIAGPQHPPRPSPTQGSFGGLAESCC